MNHIVPNGIEEPMTAKRTETNSLFKYFTLVYLFSIPFWLLGSSTVEKAWSKLIPINLPLSALMLVCPAVASSILTYRIHGYDGVIQLLLRAFDIRQIQHKFWYIPIILIMPSITVVSYIVMRCIGLKLPTVHISLLMVPVYFVLFFVGAIGEEIGWTSYATDRLQHRFNALTASTILGTIWAAWHIIPYLQAHNSPSWIIGQGLFTVAARIIIVWLYNNTGMSVFAAIVFHAMVNVSWVLFPTNGSRYDPGITAAITIGIVLVVVYFWGAKTFSRNRFNLVPIQP
jgi:membrane protease YdiL (CAAX protease family)